MDKNLLRKEMKDLRLKIKDRNKRDEDIFNNLKELAEFNEATNVFIYISFNDEINTIKIIKWCLKNNKRVFVPRIVKGKSIMEAVEIKHLLQLRKNRFGIPEPMGGVGVLDGRDFELVIVPGLAFDKKGGRLGYGAGFYDRFLSKNNNGKILALAYNDMIIEDIPMEEHDVKIRKIVTESNIYIMEKNSWFN